MLWKKGNLRFYEGVYSKEDIVLHKIKFQVAIWVSNLPNFKGISIDSMVCNWKQAAFPILSRAPVLSIGSPYLFIFLNSISMGALWAIWAFQLSVVSSDITCLRASIPSQPILVSVL